jgi:hypothetical protein
MVIGHIVNARDQVVAAGSQILPSLDLFRPTRQPPTAKPLSPLNTGSSNPAVSFPRDTCR